MTLALSVFLAALAACGRSADALSVPAGAQAGQLVNLEACSYKDGGERYNADCGALVVPENRADPAARLIALPVIRVRALSANAGEPIFWLAGGPGGTNMEFSGLTGLVEMHDIVMVGYRGMDGTVTLECPEMGQAAKGRDGDLLSAASTANFGDAMLICASRYQAQGVDLAGYTIPEVVGDMEAARTALGYDRVNLLGASFGTRVALFYAWMAPDSLHRSAMLSVNPPGHFVFEPDEIDAQIAYDAGLCAQDPGCSERTSDLAGTMAQVLRELPDRWLMIPIDPGKVRFMTHFMLFHRGTAAMAFDAYLAAAQGDPSGLALMSLAADFMIPSTVTWGDWAAKGSLDYDPGRDWIADMNPAGSIIGSPTSMLVGAAIQQRGGWPVGPTPDEFLQVQPSDVETLLVSGSIDYSTPARFATQELLPALGSGEQVILAEFGHFNDLWSLQPEAMRQLRVTFFESGTVDASGFTYWPMNFHVGLGFPVLAKLALVAAVLVPGGLFLGAWYLVRRLRRKRAA